MTSEKDNYKKVSFGFGNKVLYKVDKKDETTPGPTYET
jgi:hypothetical protein